MIIIQVNSLLFMCRVNSYKANYRQHSVDTSNHIKDKQHIKTRDKLWASTGERKHINTEKVNKHIKLKRNIQRT
jgi:hypothetical protein